tara:strand:- start:226 stop:582 length:357 start_codon:yes stop_codon:yes gene_type:complete
MIQALYACAFIFAQQYAESILENSDTFSNFKEDMLTESVIACVNDMLPVIFVWRPSCVEYVLKLRVLDVAPMGSSTIPSNVINLQISDPLFFMIVAVGNFAFSPNSNVAIKLDAVLNK